MASIRISKPTAILLGFLLQYGVVGADAEEHNPDTLAKLINAINEGQVESALPELKELAFQGFPEATFALGLLFRDGINVPRDYTKARNLFAQGAFHGDPRAMNALGLMYRDGLGVSTDLIEAYAWFRVAAEGGNKNAENHRNTLEQSLTKEKRASGRALALRRELEIELLSHDRITRQPKLHTTPANTDSSTRVAKALHREAILKEDKPQNLNKTSSVPSSATVKDDGKYMIQIGVFARQESIDKIYEQATVLGLALIESDRTVDGKTATRVDIGPFIDKEEADRVSRKLDQSLSIKTKIIRVAP